MGWRWALAEGCGRSKTWALRVTAKGKRREFGLGSARDASLKEARDKALEMRRAARAGRDPTVGRKGSITFKEAAEKVHFERSKAYKERQAHVAVDRDAAHLRLPDNRQAAGWRH